MREIINLTKLFLNDSLGFSLLFYNKTHNKKEFSKQLFTMIIVSVALIPAFFMYISFMTALYTGLRLINQVSVFLTIGYIFTSVIIIIFGIMYILSEFYFSKNMEELIPLPIAPRKIIISKFASILVLEYVFAALMFIPVLMIYGIGQGMGLGYVFLAFVVFLTLPLLPLSLETALIMTVMRSSSIKGRQDVVQIIFIIIGISLIIGIQFWFGAQMGSTGEVDLQTLMNSLLNNNEKLLNMIGYFAPASLLVAWGLNETNLMSVFWVFCLTLITAFSFGLMVFIGERFFIASLITGKTSRKGKKLTRAERQKSLGPKSHGAMAIFAMDMRLLLRTPIFLLNNVSVVIIVPLCILIILSFSPLTPQDFDAVKSFYDQMPMVVNFMLMGFFVFFGATSATTATTFSREGRASWLTRIVPVSPRDQIIGRTASALVVQSLGILFTLIGVYYYLPLTGMTILLTVILGVLGTVPILLFGLLIDMNRPLLEWDNPQKAVKNNMNVVITLFGGMAYVGLLLLISAALGYFVNQWLAYGLFAMISGILTAVFYKIINKNLEERLLAF
ncbi:putative ABC transporter permease subunit [Acetobacterium sp.]|uniref:putative ABC transporter permease subunit n=1 Tax=Acetobacterium sp. TaxID=1872094 RepID=UPI002F3FFBDA